MAGLGKLNKWKPLSGLINKNYIFNTATGKANHEETFVFLIDVIDIGRNARGQFIEDLAKVQADEEFNHPNWLDLKL